MKLNVGNLIQAALASGDSLTIGGVLPPVVVLLQLIEGMEYWLYDL
jgi:hypothetical protein